MVIPLVVGFEYKVVVSKTGGVIMKIEIISSHQNFKKFIVKVVKYSDNGELLAEHIEKFNFEPRASRFAERVIYEGVSKGYEVQRVFTDLVTKEKIRINMNNLVAQLV